MQADERELVATGRGGTCRPAAPHVGERRGDARPWRATAAASHRARPLARRATDVARTMRRAASGRTGWRATRSNPTRLGPTGTSFCGAAAAGTDERARRRTRGTTHDAAPRPGHSATLRPRPRARTDRAATAAGRGSPCSRRSPRGPTSMAVMPTPPQDPTAPSPRHPRDRGRDRRAERRARRDRLRLALPADSVGAREIKKGRSRATKSTTTHSRRATSRRTRCPSPARSARPGACTASRATSARRARGRPGRPGAKVTRAPRAGGASRDRPARPTDGSRPGRADQPDPGVDRVGKRHAARRLLRRDRLRVARGFSNKDAIAGCGVRGPARRRHPSSSPPSSARTRRPRTGKPSRRRAQTP